MLTVQSIVRSVYPLSVLHTTQTLSWPGAVSVATTENLHLLFLPPKLVDDWVLVLAAACGGGCLLTGFSGVSEDLGSPAIKLTTRTDRTTLVCYTVYH